jgi:hypothetical protein
MTFDIRIRCENVAPRGGPAIEVARTLRKLAERVEGYAFAPGRDGEVYDTRGEIVGSFAVEEDKR